jgi:hypothetical protein
MFTEKVLLNENYTLLNYYKNDTSKIPDQIIDILKKSLFMKKRQMNICTNLIIFYSLFRYIFIVQSSSMIS